MAVLKFNGEEIPLAFTVRAKIELGKIGGKHSYSDFITSIDGTNDEQDFDRIYSAIKILHEAYLRKQAIEDGRPYQSEDFKISKEDFLDVDIEEWSAMQQAIIDTIMGDSKTTVQTEPIKKK